MRKLILKMECSLDGYVSGPNGELDWLDPDFGEDYVAWIVPRLWQADAHLMGRVTYEDMAAHWPASNEPFAAPMNQIPKIVFSDSLSEVTWRESQIVSGELAPEMTWLKQEPGGELLVHGGARFAQSLIQAGLLDEYRLVVHPVLLGAGVRLFPALPEPVRFSLVEAITFDSGAMVKVLQPVSP